MWLKSKLRSQPDLSRVAPRHLLTMYENYGFETQVLAASVRSPLQVAEVALLGAHCATLPLSVLQKLVKHPLTDAGLSRFAADAKKNAAAAI